jgi:heterotetrameric sarcosine oxidase gamma subunit
VRVGTPADDPSDNPSDDLTSLAAALGTVFGRATWQCVEGVDRRVLVTGAAPGEWLLLAGRDQPDAVVGWLESLPATGEFVTVVDLTHDRAVVRISGALAKDVLAKESAVDLSDRPGGAPDGRALRTEVAGLATELIRTDIAGIPSYLLHCERSSGKHLFDSLLDSGAEHGIDVDGFSLPGFDSSPPGDHPVGRAPTLDGTCGS